jgi:hypothetical protein
MNKPIKPPSTADAELLSAIRRSDVRSHIADPATAEREITERVRARYRGDNPQIAVAEAQIEEEQAVLAGLREFRERHMQATRGGDLMRERYVGQREHALTLFDFGLFAFVACVGVGGNLVALSNLATYVADSGAIASLTDNFFRALFVSAIPFSGSVALKVIGAFQADNKAERAFNLRTAWCAVAFVAVHILALTIFYAPHKFDGAALAEALASGVAPTNPIVAALQNFASYLVLGSGLAAEMLITPVAINYAQKLHRAGREIIVVLHDEQVAHREAIAVINQVIAKVIERIGQAQSELDKHASALAEMMKANLHLHRETAADLKTVERRATEEFFAKRDKGVSR